MHGVINPVSLSFCIQKGANSNLEAIHLRLRFCVVLLSPSRQMPGNYLMILQTGLLTTSFHILPNSLFPDHPTIDHCLVRATMLLLNKQQISVNMDWIKTHERNALRSCVFSVRKLVRCAKPL